MTDLTPGTRFYDFGPFRLDAVERVLFKDGEPVRLPPKVFDTLAVLVTKSGHIIGREEIMNAVWQETFVEEANLSVNISALRKVLGRNNDGTDLIETVARRGYRFRGAVSKIVEPFHEDDMLLVRRRLRARLIRTETDGPSVRDERPRLEATNEPINSLAVLPFRINSGEGADEFLSLSLADALITQLGNSGRVIVRPLSSVERFAKAGNSDDAARELHVDAILECGVENIGETLRVTARLRRGLSNVSVWADNFELKFDDMFAVQSTIAERVGRSLIVKLNEHDRERLSKRYTTSGDAFREYLTGRYFWNKRNVEGFQKAIEYFKKAIDLDPTYALAYTGLADTYNMLPMWGEMPPKDGYVLANAAALRALEIDPDIADVHASLGYTKYIYAWDWLAVEESYRRAIALNPNCVAARNWYAKFCVSLRRFDAAHEQMGHAYEIDPLSPMVATSVIAVYLYERKYDEAIDRYSRLLKATPNFVPALLGLGLAQTAKGDELAAITAHRSAVEHSGENKVVVGVLAGTMARFGSRDEPLGVIEDLRKEQSRYSFLSHTIAMINANLDNRDEAFAWLEVAFNDRVSHMVDLAVDPEFDNLRFDARFDSLLFRLGLT